MEICVIIIDWTLIIVAVIMIIPSLGTFILSLKIKKHTDGMYSHMVETKDAQIKSSGELGKEQGAREATAEAKIEIDQLNKNSEPKK